MILLYLSGILFVILLFTTFYLNWKMFERAAVEGWWSLIPFVNTFKMYKIAKLPVWLFVISFVFIPIHLYAAYKFYREFSMTTLSAILSVLIPFWGPVSIVFGTYEYNFE